MTNFQNYQDRSYVDRIKAALKNGGIVVAPRGSGKTRALAEILAEDPECIVVVTMQSHFARLREFYANVTGKELEGGRLFHVSAFTNPDPGRCKGWPFDPLAKQRRMYVDELWLASGDFNEDFHAAVTSFPYPLTVIS